MRTVQYLRAAFFAMFHPVFRFVSLSFLFGTLMLSYSCEKVIEVDIPEKAEGIVFEGRIESGSFPYVIISRSKSYFTPIVAASTALLEVLVDSAEVFITVDGQEYMLDRICLNDLPTEYQEQAQGLLGLETIPEDIQICVFASLNPALTGQPGKNYGFRAIVEGKEYRSSTKVPELVHLDSLWFKLDDDSEQFGIIWTKLDDPDTLGNNYFLWTKRMGRDSSFISVRSPSFDDRLFNGERFDMNMQRGRLFGQSEEAENNDDEDDEEKRRFRLGDTVVVKLGTTDSRVYRFWRTALAATQAGFNPFASPVTVISNIDNDGRGVWGGYGVTYDTIICIPVE